MDSPDVVQNAKDSNDWRHQVTNLMQDEDNGDGAGDTASEAFNCGICSKSLKNKESLRKHKKTHTIKSLRTHSNHRREPKPNLPLESCAYGTF